MDIKSLKDKILQLAIYGKLVSQNENDIPASLLLEKIKIEKEQLIKDKVIKKEKALPEIIEDETLLDLPQKWEWCRLSDIYRFIDYRGKTPNKIDNGIPLVTAKNVRMGFIDYKIQEFISIEEFEERKTRGVSKKGDILFTTEAPMGNVAIADLTRFSAGQRLITLQQYTSDKLINNQLFMYFIMSQMFQKQLMENKTGTTVYGIKAEKLKKLLLPVPPLEEQERIVSKIDELFKLIDELDNNKQDLLETISNSRNKVLQLAIQGKLVEQCECDEPAIVLLEKIKQEKEQLIKDKVIKKEKSLSEIGDEEKVFDLPKGWEWCRFGRATICRDGERVPVSAKDREDKDKIYDYYGASGIIDKIDKYLFDKELLLIGEDGANLVSRSTPIAFIAKGKYWVNNHAHVIDSLELTTLKYLEIYINAIDLKPFVTGTAQPKLNQANLNRIPIALPPLEEQKRIVDKVDLIFNYLSKLQREIETKNIIEDIIK